MSNHGVHDLSCRKTTSSLEESLHRSKMEIEMIRREAEKEISRLDTEKESLIKQAVSEITRLNGEVKNYRDKYMKIESHSRSQGEIIDFLRRRLAELESANHRRDLFDNQVEAF